MYIDPDDYSWIMYIDPDENIDVKVSQRLDLAVSLFFFVALDTYIFKL